MANPLVITTPRGCVQTVSCKNGAVKARVVWNPGFGPTRTAQFVSAQQRIDAMVLRLDDPYMPRRTSTLIRSGTLGTVIGSGEVEYIAPYAHMQYYRTAQTREYDPNRGGMWFERMKADHRAEILRAAAKEAGGKAHG